MNLTIPGVTVPIMIGTESILGGGIRGLMPRSVLNVDKECENYENVRFTLTQAWNNSYKQQLRSKNLKRIQTPFRVVNNAGDVLSRQNYSCGGSCQSFQNRPNMFGLKGHFGSIYSNCDNSDIPPASCNTKYVYDSSNYTTFLKQQAMNKTYNDFSYGGDNYNSSQVAIQSVRRY